MKRFLLLAALLDRAALAARGARGAAPLLFRVDAPVKTSAEVGRVGRGSV